MSLQPFQDEQLNYFKFASIVLNEFPKALRHTFKSMWDNTFGHRPGFQPWDDSIAVRNLFLTTDGGTTKVPTNSSYEEWDSTALFQATIYARSFALPDSKGHHRTLSDLYVKPHNLAHGKFHASLMSPGGNRAETFALAIDQLRLLRNSLCHSSRAEIGKPTFDQYIQHAKDAFKALGVKADPIDVIGSLTESDFPTKEVRKLEQAIKDETQAYLKFLEGMCSDNHELRALLTAMKERSASKEDIATLERKIDDLTAKVAPTQDEPVSEDVPDKLVADLSWKMAKHWKLVAVYLGFTNDHVATFEVDNVSVSEKVIAMFGEWKHRKTKDATRSNLMEALEKAGRKDLAEEVCSYQE